MKKALLSIRSLYRSFLAWSYRDGVSKLPSNI